MSLAPLDSLTIVGFGLIGASLARAVRARAPEVTLRAIDVPAVARQSEASAWVDVFAATDDPTLCRELIASSTLTVLAGPVRVIVEHLPDVLRVARTVTDCGSTKRAIATKAQSTGNGGRFVPGHPMAGKTRSGFAAASADLFKDETWILCPDGADADAVSLVRDFVTFVGAHVVEMSVAKHDSSVALTSHLPKLLAALLVRRCRAINAEAARGPAFRSATRVADGDVGIWSDIFVSNADELAVAAQHLSDELDHLATELRRGDTALALSILDEARRSKD
jgi:prephenate dehydrogenase